MGMRAKGVLMLANMRFVTQNLHLEEPSGLCQTPGFWQKLASLNSTLRLSVFNARLSVIYRPYLCHTGSSMGTVECMEEVPWIWPVISGSTSYPIIPLVAVFPLSTSHK